MNIINTTYSPYLPELRLFRDEVKRLKDITDSKTNDYAFYFVCLFCKAVCKNVDNKGKTSLTDKPQLYVDGDNLSDLFGLNNDKDTMKILGALKNEYKVIDYEVLKSKHNGAIKKIIYIYINFDNSFPKGIYSRKNQPAYNNAMAIKNDIGFVTFSKKQFYEHFYENANNKHCYRDLYLLCRMRTTYNDPKFSAIIPSEQKDKAISLWKAKDKDGDDITVCYKREKEFANTLGVSEKSIKRYFVALENAGMIEHYYKIKKGIVVIATHLETLLTE